VLIPDGNRTYALMQGLPALLGHTMGKQNARRVIRAAFDFGVQNVVFWAASELNLQKREPAEIGHLCCLLKEELRRRLCEPEEVRFRLIGPWQRFCPDEELAGLAATLAEKTVEYEQRQLTILFGYSGRTEMIEAVCSLNRAGEQVTEDSLRNRLWTGYLPDVDLVIRTGVKGNPHLSDCLLMWQMRNPELYFSEVGWPNFGPDRLTLALKDFGARSRKLGT